MEGEAGMSDVFAVPGEIVACANGHEICTVAEPLVRYEVMRSSQFKDWKFEIDLTAGMAIPPCPACGAWFIGFVGDGNRVHIDGEWRPVEFDA